MTNSPVYAKIKAKCLDCSLHFVLYAIKANSYPTQSLYCPGCGQHEGNFMTWAEEANGFIFQEVPGEALPRQD